MAHPLVLVTGFGSFEEVEANPSQEIALRLEAQSSPHPAMSEFREKGLGKGEEPLFRACVLPVSFERCPPAIDRFVEESEASFGEPELLLALGVMRDPGFRLERIARPRLFETNRPDVDGMSAVHAEPYTGELRRTSLDLDGVLAELHGRGFKQVEISEDAGGYVCERTYYRVLTQAARFSIPGLFVHVPPLTLTPLEEQLDVCRGIVRACLS